MIIGGSKKATIENIKKNIKENNLNKKAELNDPNLTDSEIDNLLNKFYNNKNKKISYFFKSKCADLIIKMVGITINKDITIEGIENIEKLDLSKGAVVTCNHFNPLDSYNIRKLAKKLNKKLYIVIQDTNLALPKYLGFLMNYSNVIPIKKSPNYIINKFTKELKKVLNEGNLVLIYPEEEMWFNYKLPRPTKRGAYQFASQMKAPIISCFVQMNEKLENDNNEFKKLSYKLHVLKPLIYDDKKGIKENSINLKELDYKQKKASYEKAYNKELDYKFSYKDIAGYIKN